MTLKESVQFIEVEQRPALLQIAKPTPLITLKEPICDIIMLQGTFKYAHLNIHYNHRLSRTCAAIEYTISMW